MFLRLAMVSCGFIALNTKLPATRTSAPLLQVVEHFYQ
jgi:hypothetical protein